MEINNTIPDFDLDESAAIIIDLLETDDTNNNDGSNNDNLKDTTPDNNVDDDKQPIEVSDTAKALYEQLVEENILTEDDDFDGSWEGLRNKVNELPQRILNTLIENKTDVTKDVLRFAFSSDNITKEEMVNFIKTNLEELNAAETSIESMDEARAYLESVYKERGLKPKAIDNLLQSLEEDETLLDEAKEELEKAQLKSKPKTEELIAQKEKEEFEQKQARINFTNSIINALDETGWKPNKINEIKQRISSNQVNPLLSEIFKSPKALVKLIDFIGYYKNGDIVYDNFINNVETPKAKDFRYKLENAVSSPTTGTKSNLKDLNSDQDNLQAII